MPDTLSLSLNDGEFRENQLFRIRRDDRVRFSPGSSLLGKKVILYSNYPEKNKEFVRDKYRVLQWLGRDEKPIKAQSDGTLVNDLDTYCEIVAEKAGSFRFYFTYELNGKEKGSLYIQIEPKLFVGTSKARKYVPLDAIRCQTVLAKCLGPISSWEAKFKVAKESAYNMIHFTPIHELGGSRSCYSLADQLKVNPEFAATKGGKIDFPEVEKQIKKLREEWGIGSICDIVLNHTANESQWLQKYPESTYSCFTCPHLRPAFLLDALLEKIGTDVAEGKLESVGIPKLVNSEEHLQALERQIQVQYLPQVNLHEFFQCDVEKNVTSFIELLLKAGAPHTQHRHHGHEEENIVIPARFKLIDYDINYRRVSATIIMHEAVKIYNLHHDNVNDEKTRIAKCAVQLRKALQALNDAIRHEIDADLTYAIKNCLAATRYERVQHDGPRYGEICVKYPLFQNYFTKTGSEKKTIKEIEKMMYTDAGKFFMAHNGWVMNGDPLKDFAAPSAGDANVYFRRELISWGDSVKLRKINPELYVIAELFTNSPDTDNIFVNRLGINSLIREAMSAWDSHEEGRLVYLYGGIPVGAFFVSPKRPFSPNIAHALFLDLTHDNPSPVQKRSVFDLLPSASLCAMACCATGSTRGYDEFVPHHIHVVDEERQYMEWGKHVTGEAGMITARRAINTLHGEMAEQGFNQVYVDQMNPDVVAVTRYCPKLHQTVILIAHTSFSNPHTHAGPTGMRPLCFEGNLDEIILEATIGHKTGPQFQVPSEFVKHKDYINGLTEYHVNTKEHIALKDSNIFAHQAHLTDTHTELKFENLKPGSVVAIRVSLKEYAQEPMKKLLKVIDDFHSEKGTYLEVKNIVKNLDLVDLNHALFVCKEEERDLISGSGAYSVQNVGDLVYCGLQGVVSFLSEISPKNDLGHPLCGNLRDGNWLMDYILNRMDNITNLRPLGKWLRPHFDELKSFPRYMIPSHFDVLVTGIYNVLVDHAYELMSPFVKSGSAFTKVLSLSSLQFTSRCRSAVLPKVTADETIEYPTISAGLPHFATGYMRSWGRDTFIALPGLLLLTGRFDEAKQIILSFGTTMRHGLIPNLLDSGRNPRFNCRDAVWWWLYCIVKYATTAPNGENILKEKISRIFPTDESVAKAPGEHMQVLYDTIQEALTVHFQELSYRERNAGTKIDEHMKDEGFNNKIGVNLETGFVYGGNALNCGTWMDKMGSCDKAGNRGIPTTPRDGSAVELVGLQFATLRFLEKMAANKVIPHKSVQRTNNGTKTVWTYKEWADRIAANFEQNFYVPHGEVSSPLANKRGIYKDSLNASKEWADFQLRPNFPISMVAAPELFDPKHAWEALEMAKKYLLGPLGMKTLDPEDYEYRGYYDNSADCDDPKISHGANYHQGPEWLWPIGFFLRARLHFAKLNNCLEETKAETWSILTKHLHEMQTSHWKGLPELTNENGSYCEHSCRTQAWSVATVLEVVYDLERL